MEARREAYARAAFTIDTSELNIDQVAETVMARFGAAIGWPMRSFRVELGAKRIRSMPAPALLDRLGELARRGRAELSAARR